MFGERLWPRVTGGASKGHTGHCSLSVRGGNSDGPVACCPPGADPGTQELLKQIRLGIYQTLCLVVELLVVTVGQSTRGASPARHGWSVARAQGLLAFPELSLIFVMALLPVCLFSPQPAPCSSLTVTWKDIFMWSGFDPCFAISLSTPWCFPFAFYHQRSPISAKRKKKDLQNVPSLANL